MPYCVNCGYKLAGNENECPSCGQRVNLSRTTVYQVNDYGTTAGAPGATSPVPKPYQVNTGATGSYAPAPSYGTGTYAAPVQGYGTQPAYGTGQQPYSAAAPYTAAAPYGAAISVPVAAAPSNEKGSVGWWFLGFFFPLIGLILCLAWRSQRRGDARKAGFGALTGAIVSVVFGIIITVTVAMMAPYMDDYTSDFDYSSSGYGHTEELRSEYVWSIDE